MEVIYDVFIEDDEERFNNSPQKIEIIFSILPLLHSKIIVSESWLITMFFSYFPPLIHYTPTIKKVDFKLKTCPHD